MELAYQYAEESHGDFEEEVMAPLREAKLKIDTFMDTLPKRQQAIYAESLEQGNKDHKPW